MQAYNHATEKPHGYLFIDFDQNTPEAFRLRTNVLPDEYNIVYTLKSKKSEKECVGKKTVENWQKVSKIRRLSKRA